MGFVARVGSLALAMNAALWIAACSGGEAGGGSSPKPAVTQPAAPVAPAPAAPVAPAPTTDPNAGTTPAPAGPSFPAISAEAGQLQLDLDGISPDAVQGYVVGMQDKVVQKGANGELFIEGIPAGAHDVVITAGQIAVTALTASDERGRRINDVEVKNGQATKLEKVTLPKVGSISGVAKRMAQADHAGIRVYIPGTSYAATTDGNGNYAIPNVPVGVHNLFFDYQLYHRGRIENVGVFESGTLLAPSITLALASGATGFVIINNGDARSKSKEVDVIIGATPEALLMKLAEENSFTGVTPVPVQSTTKFTFASEGQKELFVELIDESGIQNQFSSTILIDGAPPTAGTLTGAPTGTSGIKVLNVTAAAQDVSAVSYRHKVGAGGTTNCGVEAGYGAPRAATQKIDDDITSVADGVMKLCAWFGDATGQFTPVTDATTASWTKDGTGPVVDLKTPAANAVAVSLKPVVKARFSEDINGIGTALAPKFSLRRVEDGAVAKGAAATYVANTLEASLDFGNMLATPLDGSTQYEAAVDASVEDQFGNPGAETTWRFTTGSGWISERKMATFGSDLIDPQVVVDGAGNAVVVYRKLNGAVHDIVARSFTAAGGWSSEQALESQATRNATNLTIGINANGVVAAAWRQAADGGPGDVKVWVALREAGASKLFGAAVAVSGNSMDSNSGQGAALSLNATTAYVAWAETGAIKMSAFDVTLLPGGGSWSAAETVSGATTHPEEGWAASAYTGGVIFGWFKESATMSDRSLQLRRYDGTTFDTAFGGSGGSGTYRDVKIFTRADGSGNATTWRDSTAPGMDEIVSDVFNTASFNLTNGQVITNKTIKGYDASIATDATGALLVEIDDEGMRKVIGRHYANGIWTTTNELIEPASAFSTTQGFKPRVAAANGGIAVATWSGFEASAEEAVPSGYRVKVARFAAGVSSWDTRTIQTASAGTTNTNNLTPSGIHVSADAAHAFVMFSDHGTPKQIWFGRYK